MRSRIMIALARHTETRDRGYALVSVLGVGMLMIALVAVALNVSTNSMRKTDTENNWTSAYAAAVAGLNDYKSRLTSAPNYVKYGNMNANFSKTSKTQAGAALLSAPPSDLDNPAFDVDVSGRWANVPGNTNGAQFRYEVNTKDYASSGIIHVRSTGRVGTSVRSVIADLRKKGFFDFVYFTQYEVTDSRVTGSSTDCARYPWDSPARPDTYTKNGQTSKCVVQFAGVDTLKGDIFSDDQFTSCGATFEGDVTSAAPKGYDPIDVPNGCAQSVIKQSTNSKTGGANPANGASIFLPPSAASLAAEATSDGYTGDGPGCTYTGPTQIVFNADGSMNVISPWTRVTRPSQDGSTGTSPSDCGAVSTTTSTTQTNTLQSIGGAKVTVPKDNVIWVQDVPTDSSDVNYPKGGLSSDPAQKKSFTAAGATFSCTKNAQRANNAYGWSLSQSGNTTVQYPRDQEDYVPNPGGTNAYTCNTGDVYLSGTLKGHVTIGANRYAYVTGDLKYATNSFIDGSDYNLLGVVGQSAIVVWNPMSYQVNGPLLPANREINAALLAVDGTIMVQNYDVGGTRGTLTIKGSLAQKYRGTVATGGSTLSTGFSKSYAYDPTLKYNAPPKYLAPANLSYGVSQIASVPAAFTVTGAKAANS